MPPANRHHNALPHGYRLNVYRIDRVIGQGGFGITYLGEDNLERKVAIKEYFPTELAARVKQEGEVKPISDDRVDMFQWGLNRFLDEAKTLARFKHPNIVSIRNFFEEKGTAYAVMPYEEGDPLDQLIRQGKVTDEESLLNVLMPILDGLEKVHATGLIHRDIKPANIYIRHDGSPVLIDFGSARTAVGQQTKTLTALVSPGYAPFEQYHGSGSKQGPWTDIYALGATLYAVINRGRGLVEATMRADYLLEGKRDPLVSAAEIGEGRYSPLFLEAIDAALVFRPDSRPQTIAEWRQWFHSPQKATPKRGPTRKNQADIHTLVHTGNKSRKHTAPAKDTGRSDPLPQTSSKKRLIAAVLLLAIGAGGYFTWQSGMISGQQTAVVQQDVNVQTRKKAVAVKPKTGKAILYINSTPSGATVLLNGEEKGKTPYEAEDLIQGDYQLQLVHPDMQDYQQRITLTDHLISKQDIPLKAATGDLTLISQPAGAHIRLDGKATQQQTPASLTALKTGTHKVTLSKDRYYPKTLEFKIQKGKIIKLETQLEGGHLVKYKGKWVEPKEKTRLVAIAKQKAEARRKAELARKKAEAEAKRIAAEKLKAQAKAKRIAEQKRKVEAARQQAEQLAGKMITIPAGTFQMGSNDGSAYEKPVHRVTIKAFKMGQTEVTQAQWQAIMGNNPSRFKGDNRPVERVSWDDVQEFIRKLNQKTGQTYRLPTEAEWEYACRGGRSGEKYCGGDEAGRVAWYTNNSGMKTHPVGQKQTNGFGLEDMSGNVWEWVQDCWNEDYKGAPSDGSAWTDGNCMKRVLRGGSWIHRPGGLRSANRARGSTGTRGYTNGFRLVQD